MKVAVHEVHPWEKRLEIEVPADVVQKELDKAYKTLASHIQLPGFRKGKIPRPVLERYYRGKVEDEVIQKLIPDLYKQALASEGIQAVAEAKVESIELEQAKNLKFTATVEVLPPIALTAYHNWEFTEEITKITEADIDQALAALQKQHSHWESVDEETPVAEGHYVLLDYEGFVDGVPLQEGKQQNYAVELGTGALIPEFEQQLFGLKKQEERDIVIAFPADYRDQTLAGKTVTFHVVIKEIKRRVLPELNDEFARSIEAGDSVAALREKVRQELEAQMEREARRELEEAVVTKLLEANPFPLPPALITQRAQFLLHTLQNQFPAQAQGEEPLKLTPEAETQLRIQAERQVKRELILQKIAEAEGLTVSDEELEAEVQKVADRLQQDVSSVKRLLAERGTIESIKQQLLEEKAFERILALNTVRKNYRSREQKALETAPEEGK